MGSELKVGFIVIIALGILTYFLVNIGEWNLFGDQHQTYQVVSRFGNVVGLIKGAAVALSGVRIGEVADIRLEGHRALVVMMINDEVDFPDTSKARISSVGLLGQASVDIIPIEAEGAHLARETGEIGSLDPVTVDQLVAVIQDISNDATELVGSVRDFLYGNEARIINILENLRTFSDNLDKVVAQNADALKSSLNSINELTFQMREDLPVLLGDVKTLAADLREVMENRKDEISTSMVKAKDLLEKLDSATATLQEILDKINKGEGSVGKLLNDSETVDHANEILSRMDTMVTDFQEFLKSPTSLSFDYGFRSEFFARSEDFKYYYRLAIHFNPTDSVLMELVNDQIHNKPPVLQPDEPINGSNQALDFLGADFSFTATYGRKFPGGMARVGLIESTTGVAIDLGARTDRLSFSIEGYDFGRNKGPHIKVSAKMKLYQGLFLIVGYDDPADERRSQLFYGGGYRF